MAKDREEVKLAFQVELESRKALQGLALIDKGLRQVTRKNTSIKWDDRKGFGDFKKRFVDYRKQLHLHKKEMTELGKVLKKVGGQHGKEFSKSLKEYNHAHGKFVSDIVQSEKKLADGVSKIRALQRHTDTKEAKAAAEEQIKELEKLHAKEAILAKKALNSKQAALAKAATGPGKAQIMEKHAEQVEQRQKAAKEFSEAIEDIKTHSMGKDMADGFTDGLGNLASKDLLGVAKSGVSLSASLFKGAGKLGMKWGRDLQTASAAKGGGGGAMGAVGGLMKGIGPLVATLSKLGPILAGVAGIFGAIFKLMSAVEGAAKDMNKQLLEGSATAGILAKNGFQAGKAYGEVVDTLDAIRAYATSGAGLDIGMTKDDILQMSSSLMQQGLSIDRVNKAFDTYRDTIKGASVDANGYITLARTAFVWSKSFGVSLQEVNDFQSELFQDMGASFKSVNLGLARMSKDAGDSGIAVNKFFSIIRSVSTDLGLYNTRLDQASTILKKISKVMNEKQAAKFMQTLTQGMSQMDILTRTRVVAMAGPEASGIQKKDVANKTEALVQELANNSKSSIDDIRKAFDEYLKGNTKELNNILSTTGMQEGALSNTALELSRAIKFGANKDLVSQGEAVKYLSMGATLAIQKAGMLRVANQPAGGRVSDVKGPALAALQEKFGDMFNAVVNMETAVRKQRDNMMSVLDGTMKDEETRAQLQEQLNELGIKTLDQLKAMPDAQLFESGRAADQKDIEKANAKAEADAKANAALARQVAKSTVTMEQRLEAIQDGIFNYLFVVMRGVLEAANGILSMLGKDSVSGVLDSGRTDSNTALVDVLQKAGEGKGESASRQAMLLAVDKVFRAQFKQSRPEDQQYSFAKKVAGSIAQLSANFQTSAEGQNIGMMQMLASMKGLDQKKAKKATDAMSGGADVQTALMGASFTTEELAKIQHEALWRGSTTSAEDTAKRLSGNELAQQGASGGLAAGVGVPGGTRSSDVPTIEQAKARAGYAPGLSPEMDTSAQAQSSNAAATTTSPSTSASTPPQVPGQQTLPGVTIPQVGGDEIVDVLDTNGAATVKSLQDLYNAMRLRGILIDKNQLSGDFKNAIKGGTLDSLRTALAEYAMYSSDDPAKVLQNMKDSGLGAVVGQAEAIEKAREDAGKPPLKANASGGMVTGVAGGRAVIAAQGEGLASVGKGERIVPPGGRGGGGVVVNVNGIGGADLANLLQKKIAEGIYEYKRREKFQ